MKKSTNKKKKKILEKKNKKGKRTGHALSSLYINFTISPISKCLITLNFSLTPLVKK